MNTPAESLVTRPLSLPPMPQVAAELLSSMGREEIDVSTLARKIAADQALAAKTLRLANSSFYGLSTKVATIQQAITVLGFRSVRSLVTACAMTSVWPQQPGHPPLERFWLHSVAAGAAARALAMATRRDSELAFIAGLLHDLGSLVLASQFPAHYQKVIEAIEAGAPSVQAEQEILGMDHAQIGGALAEHWRFPPSIREAVAAHHAEDGSGGELGALVAGANVLAHCLAGERSTGEEGPAIMARLGLPPEALDLVMANTQLAFGPLKNVLLSQA
ncbi:HDOD domain-containing protein [Massilia endophytica]|uniref:HDOD domain-containing protein n=1 Tax=Massilia endophytica TaxID=2899220 RepID=UPI001E3325D5|nr:HDOD domain-containing protein [Massilia endophytica]UGQ49129.1 HDOD domain-containing protein [Massilia endophytica]